MNYTKIVFGFLADCTVLRFRALMQRPGQLHTGSGRLLQYEIAKKPNQSNPKP